MCPPSALVNSESQAGPRVRLPLQPFECVLGSQSEFSALGLRGSTQLLVPCDTPPPPTHTHIHTHQALCLAFRAVYNLAHQK